MNIFKKIRACFRAVMAILRPRQRVKTDTGIRTASISREQEMADHNDYIDAFEGAIFILQNSKPMCGDKIPFENLW